MLPKVTAEFVNEHGEEVTITVQLSQTWGVVIDLTRNTESNSRAYTLLETKVIAHLLRLITEPGYKH